MEEECEPCFLFFAGCASESKALSEIVKNEAVKNGLSKSCKVWLKKKVFKGCISYLYTVMEQCLS